jgi:hypothetical protein
MTAAGWNSGHSKNKKWETVGNPDDLHLQESSLTGGGFLPRLSRDLESELRVMRD